MIHRPRWYRWTVDIVGRESGNRTRLWFVRFRSHADAIGWCIGMNDAHNRSGDGSMTYYEAVRIR